MLVEINDCSKNCKKISNKVFFNERSNCLYFNLVICSVIKDFTFFNDSLMSLQPECECIF